MAIEIVDFPIDSMVIFHSYVNVYQRVQPWNFGNGKVPGSKNKHLCIAIDVGFHIAFRGITLAYP